MPDLNVALRIRADLRNAVAQIDRLEKELRQTGRAGRQAAQGTRQAAASIERAGRAADRSSRGFSRLQGAVAGISFALLAREAVRAVRSITDVGLAFERLEQRFTFGAGSVRQGAEEFRFVSEEAERLGLAFRPAAQGLSQLQAAVRGTGISLGQTREIFLGVAEAATVLRLSQDQVAGAFRAIEQIASKGTLQAEEIRGQLGERLPGAFQIAARAMGVTTAELNKMLEQGEVISEDFLPRFGAQLRREFGDAAEEAADSAQASFNRLGNSIERLQLSISRSGLLEFLADAADELTALTNAIGNFEEQLRTVRQLGGDPSVPGGGLGRDQAAALREEGLPSTPRDFLRIGRQRLAELDRLIAEREAEGRVIDIGSLIPIIGTQSLEDLRAEADKVRSEVERLERSIEGATERERFLTRRRNDATIGAPPEPDRDAIDEFEKETE
ncbi:MAG: tape measure protein, partial [Alphaproteobacteria bacterium]|nr:tape measure protein [Alphaproteobacteria bacterium]